MIQSSMLASFAAIPVDKLPKVVEALNLEASKLGPGIAFMLAKHNEKPVIRAQITAEDFAGVEHLSDRVEELLTKLGGNVDERMMAGEEW